MKVLLYTGLIRCVSIPWKERILVSRACRIVKARVFHPREPGSWSTEELLGIDNFPR